MKERKAENDGYILFIQVCISLCKSFIGCKNIYNKIGVTARCVKFPPIHTFLIESF